jgi:hypothetical protein
MEKVRKDKDVEVKKSNLKKSISYFRLGLN